MGIVDFTCLDNIGFVVRVRTKAHTPLPRNNCDLMAGRCQIQRHIHTDGTATADYDVSSQTIAVPEHIRRLPDEGTVAARHI